MSSIEPLKQICHERRAHTPAVDRRTMRASATVLLAALFSLFAVTCATQQPEVFRADIPEGWADMETFRVIATGTPDGKARGVALRKASARGNAVSNAQKRIYYLFERSAFERLGIRDGYEHVGLMIKRTFEPVVTRGVVTKEDCDVRQACRITYEVRAINLKRVHDRCDMMHSYDYWKRYLQWIPPGYKVTASNEIRIPTGKSVEPAKRPAPAPNFDVPECRPDHTLVPGWLGDDGYLSLGCARAPRAVAGKEERRDRTKRGALEEARRNVMDRFIGMFLEPGCGTCDPDDVKAAIRKNFGDLVNAGEIVCLRFDEEDNCELFYRVRRKNLKRDVQRTDISGSYR
jgi:hypothetical protein